MFDSLKNNVRLFFKIPKYEILCFYVLAMNMWESNLKTQHYYIHFKRMKYLSVNLIKYIQDLHAENYNTLMKEI